MPGTIRCSISAPSSCGRHPSMAEAASRERLQPSLLDRLTDEVKGIESDIGRLRQELLPRLDEERSQALAQLLDPERQEPLGPRGLPAVTQLGAAGGGEG